MLRKASIRRLVFAVLIVLIALPAWTAPASAETVATEPTQSAFAAQNGGSDGGERSSPTKSGKSESSKSGKKGKGRQPTDSGKAEPEKPAELSEWGDEPQGSPTAPAPPGPALPAPRPGYEYLLEVAVVPDPETLQVGVIMVAPSAPVEEAAKKGEGYLKGILRYPAIDPLNVTVTAVKIHDDWIFDHWELKHWSRDWKGPRTGYPTGPTTEFTIKGQSEAIAIFLRVYNLTVCCTPGGRVILASSKSKNQFQVSPGPCRTGKVREGSVVTLTPKAEDGYIFDGWEGVEKGDIVKEDGSLQLRPMDRDRKITAKFRPVVPPPEEEVPPTPPLPPTPPTPPPIFPTPPTPPSIPPPSPLTPPSHVLRTSVSPAGGGSVSPNTGPGGTLFVAGTAVDITAIPADGYEFSHWSGDASGSTSPIMVTMWSDKTVTANFKLKLPVLHLLRISVNPTGGGSTNPVIGPLGRAFGAGMSLIITAIPAAGYQFSHWSDDASGSTNPIVVTMSSNKTITANFVKIIPVPPPPQY